MKKCNLYRHILSRVVRKQHGRGISQNSIFDFLTFELRLEFVMKEPERDLSLTFESINWFNLGSQLGSFNLFKH